ncbi:hypothetical protein PHLH4_20150 [Pseudomonas sp. St316]|nr:hypothetical protein PHLH4_20150 [Pseudomonas sp. St316]
MWANRVGQDVQAPGLFSKDFAVVQPNDRAGEGPVGHALTRCPEAIDRAGSRVLASGGPFGPMDFYFYQ